MLLNYYPAAAKRGLNFVVQRGSNPALVITPPPSSQPAKNPTSAIITSPIINPPLTTNATSSLISKPISAPPTMTSTGLSPIQKTMHQTEPTPIPSRSINPLSAFQSSIHEKSNKFQRSHCIQSKILSNLFSTHHQKLLQK